MLQIRLMTMDDYQPVYQLWVSANLQMRKSDEPAEVQRMIDRNPTTCLVGEENGQIVAAVLGGFDGRRGMVHHLAVHPAHQGQGYGRLMMEELERRYLELGVMRCHLFVLDTNEKVLGFYDRLGYIRRHELITMSKILIEE